MIENINEAVKEVLISEEKIAKRVKEIAEEISNDFKDQDNDLVLVGILKGAFVFLSDLVKDIQIPVMIDFMDVSSYGNSTSSTGDVRIDMDLNYNIEGKNVVIVEDIIDTGYTLSYLKQNLSSRGAKSIKIATLLDKTDRRVVNLKVDYVGFTIPDAFVIGYGLDYAELYRNLPYIGIIDEKYINKGE